MVRKEIYSKETKNTVLVKDRLLKIIIFLLLLLNCSSVLSQTEEEIAEEDIKTEAVEKSIPEIILLYLPNRIFDLLDILRLRVRVGPGFDVGVRITEPVSIYLGGHTAVYLGLPGPRLEPKIPIPIGAEAVAGASISYLDGTTYTDTSVSRLKDEEKSRFSSTNIGVETQLLLVGIDLGIDPVEIADFVTGFLLLDLRSDDL